MRAHLVSGFIIWSDYCPDESKSELLSASDPLLLSEVRPSKTEGKGVLAQDPFDVKTVRGRRMSPEDTFYASDNRKSIFK